MPLAAWDGFWSGWKTILARSAALALRFGHTMGLGPHRTSCGVMERRGAAVGVVDGASGRNGMKILWSSNLCGLLHIFVLLCYNSLKCISLHKVFGVNFESRESDHISVSGAPNNPGLDTSHVSKVLTAALEGSFV